VNYAKLEVENVALKEKVYAGLKRQGLIGNIRKIKKED